MAFCARWLASNQTELDLPREVSGMPLAPSVSRMVSDGPEFIAPATQLFSDSYGIKII